MINLLSRSAKKKLWNEYRSRLGVIILCAVLLLELFTATVFFPTYYALSTTTDSLSDTLSREQQNSPEKNDEIAKQISTFKSELSLLRPPTSTSTTPVVPSEVISRILKNKPRGIAVSAISLQKEKDVTSVLLSGIANTREDMLAYKNTLRLDPQFTVARGNDDIIKKTNITFSITLVIK